MSSPQLHRSEYARRMNRVLDYIDRHLDAPLELATLADVANFSRFHFHRMFAGWIGETLGDYIRRRRLEVGAMQLATRPNLTVLEVAIYTGFGSGEAFGRAFKTQFGCTPAAWRKDTERRSAAELAAMRLKQFEQKTGGMGSDHSNPDQSLSNPDQISAADFAHHEAFNQLHKGTDMKVEIIALPVVKIAYIRKIGSYGAEIGAFWRTTFNPWLDVSGLSHQACYGISHDDPSVTPAEKCRYDACAEVPNGFHPTGQANLAELPGGRYAVTKFVGTSREITGTWMEFFREWLPSSGLQCDARPCFEYYPPDVRMDPKTGIFECDLCIPVCSL
jgi:AraC family transcriptional regulator